MNKVKITSLDYRSGQATVDGQVVVINNFLTGKTLLHFIVDDEFALGIYTTDTPAAGEQRQIGCLINVTEPALEAAIGSLDLVDVQHVEGKTVIWSHKV